VLNLAAEPVEKRIAHFDVAAIVGFGFGEHGVKGAMSLPFELPRKSA
jgi:hypothetical protein